MIMCLDHVPDEDVQVFFRAADAVAMPYVDITTSGAVMLAMSFGLPVVAPALGCIIEAVPVGAGFLYDPDEPNGLRDAILRVRKDRSRLGEMGKVARDRAEHATWSQMALATLQAYGVSVGQEPSFDT